MSHNTHPVRPSAATTRGTAPKAGCTARGSARTGRRPSRQPGTQPEDARRADSCASVIPLQLDLEPPAVGDLPGSTFQATGCTALWLPGVAEQATRLMSENVPQYAPCPAVGCDDAGADPDHAHRPHPGGPHPGGPGLPRGTRGPGASCAAIRITTGRPPSPERGGRSGSRPAAHRPLPGNRVHSQKMRGAQIAAPR